MDSKREKLLEMNRELLNILNKWQVLNNEYQALKSEWLMELQGANSITDKNIQKSTT